jgi:hypothetical protein
MRPVDGGVASAASLMEATADGNAAERAQIALELNEPMRGCGIVGGKLPSSPDNPH